MPKVYLACLASQLRNQLQLKKNLKQSMKRLNHQKMLLPLLPIHLWANQQRITHSYSQTSLTRNRIRFPQIHPSLNPTEIQAQLLIIWSYFNLIPQQLRFLHRSSAVQQCLSQHRLLPLRLIRAKTANLFLIKDLELPCLETTLQHQWCRHKIHPTYKWIHQPQLLALVSLEVQARIKQFLSKSVVHCLVTLCLVVQDNSSPYSYRNNKQ